MKSFNKVVMIGLGYIGLPTATILATNGIKVIGVDTNSIAVETINRGEIHIVEPELDGLVHNVVANGNLVAKSIPEMADAFVIAVPTPFKGDHEPDLSYIHSAVISIAPFLNPGNLIILESTSPVGTTEKISHWLAELRPDLNLLNNQDDISDIHLAYCPERVLPGHILREIIDNDRIIGGLTPDASQMAADFYRIFVKGECIITDSRTAEMCKLTENAFRDVNIAFANELSLICDELKLDVWSLIKLANRHPRVNVLLPGPGVGGHCIAVDPWFIVDSAPNLAKLIKTSREINDAKPDVIVSKVKKAIGKVSNPTIAYLGLSFKANIDDLRESPALEIVGRLTDQSEFTSLLVEPHIRDLPDSFLDKGNVKLVGLEYALEHAQIIVVLVNHQIFYSIDKEVLENKIVIDASGLFSNK